MRSERSGDLKRGGSEGTRQLRYRKLSVNSNSDYSSRASRNVDVIIIENHFMDVVTLDGDVGQTRMSWSRDVDGPQ